MFKRLLLTLYILGLTAVPAFAGPTTGPWGVDCAAAFTSYSACRMAPPNVGKTLVVSKLYTIAKNEVVAQDVRVPQGGGWTSSTAKVLDFKGLKPDAGRYQIFFGNIVINGLAEARLEWWGPPSAATIQKAVNSGARNIRVAAGQYNWEATVTVAASNPVTLTVDSEAEYGAEFNWTGPASGTMLVWNTSWGKIEGWHLNGVDSAGIVLHVGAGATATHVEFSRVHVYGGTVAGIQWGNYSVSGLDNDVSMITLDNCVLSDNRYQMVYDSTQALNIIAKNCQWSGTPAKIQRHISMIRGGSLHIATGHMGGIAYSGYNQAIYIKDGWVVAEDLQNEGASGGGGLLLMDTATLPVGDAAKHSSVFVRCRDWSVGYPGTGFKVRMESGANPLMVMASTFSMRGISASSNQIFYNADSTARLTTIGNVYYTSNTNVFGGDPSGIRSYNDKVTTDGSTVTDVYSILSRRITINTTPYTIGRDGDYFDLGTSAGTVTLPTGQRERRITLKSLKTSGTHTLAPGGSDTIDGLSSITLNPQESITLHLDAAGSWRVLSWVGGVSNAASTGTGTVKMGSVNSANSAGWVQISPGKFVPYWSTAAP